MAGLVNVQMHWQGRACLQARRTRRVPSPRIAQKYSLSPTAERKAAWLLVAAASPPAPAHGETRKCPLFKPLTTLAVLVLVVHVLPCSG
eukprot:scaffold43703_cov18-Tisochrysis_lutea.AAC.2